MRAKRFVLASVEAVDALAVAVVIPLLPAMAERCGLGVPGAVALIVVPLTAAALAAAWLLRLSERWGRKSVLVATCLVTAEALFVLAWAGDVFMLFMSRLATGVAAGNVLVAEAARRDLQSDDERQPASHPAVTTIALGVGALAGVGLGLLLKGAGTSAVGYTAGAIAVISLFSVLAIVHETVPLSERRRSLRSE